MEIFSTLIRLTTKGFCDIKNITVSAREFIHELNITQRLLTVFIPGSTAAIITIEFEEGVVEDLNLQ